MDYFQISEKFPSSAGFAIQLWWNIRICNPLLRCLFRIINADIQCVQITNPNKRGSVILPWLKGGDKLSPPYTNKKRNEVLLALQI
jgi:hypothetical protein